MDRKITALILFGLAAIATFFLMNAQRGVGETNLAVITAAIPIWAMLLTVFSAYWTQKTVEQNAVEAEKLAEMRQKAETQTQVMTFCGELASYIGILKSIIGELEKAQKPIEIPQGAFDPYRPCLKAIEADPTKLQQHHLYLMSLYETMLIEKSSRIRQLAEKKTKSAMEEVQALLEVKIEILERYAEKMGLSDEGFVSHAVDVVLRR